MRAGRPIGRIAALGTWLVLAALAACAPPSPQPFEQDVYVWQRSWTPQVATSVRQAAAYLSAYRVLAAEVSQDGRVDVPRIDFEILRSGGRPVVAVIRLDGRLEHAGTQAEAIVPRVLAEWRGAGLTPRGIELDFDCPRSRLDEYATVLRQVRGDLDPSLELWITTLPDWLKSDALEAVLAATNGSVLQVHSVDQHAKRLVDPQLARSWIRQYSRRTTKPFKVALPAYGSTLLTGPRGDLIAIESEVPQWLSGVQRVDLVADPLETSALLRSIRKDAVAHFAGIAWFRLPTTDDQRAWSFDTWIAVLQGQTLSRHVDVVARADPASGSIDIVLTNTGAVDAPAPREIRLTPDCAEADAVNGYERSSTVGHGLFRRASALNLRVGRNVIVGWMRCNAKEIRLDTHD